MRSLRIQQCFAVIATLMLAACAHVDMRKEVISTPNAPAAIGPYSQAIRSGGMVFLSGQLPIDPKTQQLMAGESIEVQTRLVIENLGAVLQANGMTLENVVSTQVFMKDLAEFPRMNAIYGGYFKKDAPARATVEVARLPRDVKVEISAVAAK